MKPLNGKGRENCPVLRAGVQGGNVLRISELTYLSNGDYWLLLTTGKKTFGRTANCGRCGSVPVLEISVLTTSARRGDGR